MSKWKAIWISLRAYLFTTVLIVLMTFVLKPFGLAFDLVNIAIIYLLPVLFNAVYGGLRPALYSAILGVLAFDFFFVPPVASFAVSDLRYLVSFGVYLAVATLTASLAARLKRQVHYSKQKEAHTAALYALSKQMSAIADIDSMLDHFSLQVSQTLETEIAIYLTNNRNNLVLAHRTAEHPDDSQKNAELSVAQRMFEHGETADLNESPGNFIPLRAEKRIYGVMVFYPKQTLNGISTEQMQLLEALAGLAASAIARVKLAEEAKIAHLTAESERLRTAILNSVSHELRTPLAAIIGSATGLIEGEHLFSSEERMKLLFTIRDGALRMNRLVINLLSMVQLESGMLRLRKNWCDVEDLIGVTLTQVKDFQQHRKLRAELPDDDPIIVLGDEVLLEQMLVNVVSNAIKYSPDYSEIVLSVQTEEDDVVISVSDKGIGLEEDEHDRIFEKFYRSAAAKQITGTGLGLAICKGIVELHGGTISAKPNEQRGTIITIMLPFNKQDDKYATFLRKGHLES
ncbi:ATP-binding protein [Paenibacillus odorifer]|uniref:histidine kinase n=1 Tax=Paenibacillus odorifer TaxID=189426 RepID=A0A1R0XY93_9BACL|nr:ATP-binding protein [Paenibacillus odorifer]OMD40064.1 histidine kinase [Paenibacillus odorifer]